MLEEIFLPNLSAIHPKVNVPMRAPIQSIEPIHEASSGVMGPVGRGEASDNRSGRLGEVHAQLAPYPIAIKLTGIN